MASPEEMTRRSSVVDIASERGLSPIMESDTEEDGPQEAYFKTYGISDLSTPLSRSEYGDRERTFDSTFSREDSGSIREKYKSGSEVPDWNVNAEIRKGSFISGERLESVNELSEVESSVTGPESQNKTPRSRLSPEIGKRTGFDTEADKLADGSTAPDFTKNAGMGEAQVGIGARAPTPQTSGDDRKIDKEGYRSLGTPKKVTLGVSDLSREGSQVTRFSDGTDSEIAFSETSDNVGNVAGRSESATQLENLQRTSPLIVANIGVMMLNDTEINLSNTLPTLKQGPHFLSSRGPSTEVKREKHQESLKLPRIRRGPLASDEHPGFSSPFGDEEVEPVQRFRRAARLVQLILTAITSTRRENQRREAKLMSFYQLQDELGSRKGVYGEDLDFDPGYYKACRRITISDQAKQILTMDPKDRNDDQRHIALVALNQTVEAFGEFPIKMQESLVRRGWYERFEAKRVIIRQGHDAENFYFIMSGTAVVTILTTNKQTGKTFQNQVATLKKGNSFGELALMYGGTRNATVTCHDDVELLAVGRDDFVDIFMHVDKDVEPEHIRYLRHVDILSGWPIEALPYSDPKTCLFTYFRRGVIMCRDSNKNEWIYVIKTGSCRVLKALAPVKADMQTIPSSLRNSLQESPRRNKSSPSNTPGSSLTDISNNVPKLNYKMKYLPPLHRQNSKALRETQATHKAQIDMIFEERHLREKPKITVTKPAPAKDKKDLKVYVKVQKLGPKETFGLSSVAFPMMERPVSVILVSDGAECVLINKRFFTQHLSDESFKNLRKAVQPFPTEEALQQKLQDQVNWEAYKAITLQREFLHNKKMEETILI